ncbi:MAG: SH3 domain-containing protein, partial [Treponema sp.]|nr:SH3 domain-containing protein [Treponema sp.]
MMFRKIVSITFALAVLSLFSSCSGSLGYGVMLWGDEEHGISDGEIVKVYFRSNISHTYNISRTDDSEKFEIPLWKITEPESKSAASRQVKRFEEFKG